MRFIRIGISVLFALSVIFFFYVKFSNNADYNAPVIECKNEVIEVSVKATNDDLLKFITATDEKDGDLTDKVIIESVSPFVSNNSAKITYAVCDSDNNVSKIEKDIVYTDYTPPVFRFKNQIVSYVGATKVELLNGVSAYDSLEGDISSRVIVSESEIDLTLPGIYPVTYKVTTSKGITSEICVNAYVYASRLSASIALSDYLVYTDSSNKINPDLYVEEIPEKYYNTSDATYNYEYEVIDDVDYTKPGIHYITYRITRTNRRTDTDEPMVIAESYLAVAVRGERL